MLKKLWPSAAGVLVFFGSLMLLPNIFSGIGLTGLRYVYLVWLLSFCLAGLTVGWQAKKNAVFNAILFLFFSAPITIIFAVALAAMPSIFPALEEGPSFRRLLLIALFVIPFSFLGEKLYWRLHK